MSIESHGHEHEFEPQHGLPERLPANEHILWQGAPDAAAMARQVFHVRKVAVYFAVLLAWRVADALAAGAGLLQALDTVRWLAPLAVLGLGSLVTLAWLTARTTAYTLTDKRVVMRVGIVLTVTFNIPLRTLASAALRRGTGGVGDVTMTLAGSDRIAWLHLWPHVRPWRLARPEPTLRCVADAQDVAARLSKAWSAVSGIAAVPAPAEAAATATAPQWRTSPT
jgi:Bacterial PH domain